MGWALFWMLYRRWPGICGQVQSTTITFSPVLWVSRVCEFCGDGSARASFAMKVWRPCCIPQCFVVRRFSVAVYLALVAIVHEWFEVRRILNFTACHVI